MNVTCAVNCNRSDGDWSLTGAPVDCDEASGSKPPVASARPFVVIDKLIPTYTCIIDSID